MGRGGNSATLELGAPVTRASIPESWHDFRDLVDEARSIRGGFAFVWDDDEPIDDDHPVTWGAAVLQPMQDGGATLLVVGDGPTSLGYLLPPLAELERPGSRTLLCTGEMDGKRIPVIGRIQLDDNLAVLRIGPERMAIPTPLWKMAIGDWPMVRPGEKVGRNEPCPCGSGRKHKRCCNA